MSKEEINSKCIKTVMLVDELCSTRTEKTESWKYTEKTYYDDLVLSLTSILFRSYFLFQIQKPFFQNYLLYVKTFKDTGEVY